MNEQEFKLRAQGYGGFLIDGKIDPRFKSIHIMPDHRKHYATCSADLDDIPTGRVCPPRCRFCAKNEEKRLGLAVFGSVFSTCV